MSQSETNTLHFKSVSSFLLSRPTGVWIQASGITAALSRLAPSLARWRKRICLPRKLGSTCRRKKKSRQPLGRRRWLLLHVVLPSGPWAESDLIICLHRERCCETGVPHAKWSDHMRLTILVLSSIFAVAAEAVPINRAVELGLRNRTPLEALLTLSQRLVRQDRGDWQAILPSLFVRGFGGQIFGRGLGQFADQLAGELKPWMMEKCGRLRPNDLSAARALLVCAERLSR